MEPRARAGKNVGKMNFGNTELSSLLYGCGDVRNPLPETMKVLDEIATEFIQGMSFEATRMAQYSGRQKVKYEDFEFAFRRNPLYLGKVQEVFELKKQITGLRKLGGIDDETLLKDQAELSKIAGENVGKGAAGGGEGSTVTKGTGRGRKRKIAVVEEEEELGEQDDDAQAEIDAMGRKG